LNYLASMVQGLMEVSFQAMKRDVQSVSKSGSGSLGGQSGAPKQPTSQNKKGGCYVATAVYGSYDCPEVWVLRRFRDNRLSKRRIGRAFITVYYFVSPQALRIAGPTITALSRPPLNAIVRMLKWRGYSDLPYAER